jgi:O-glycosyl hydrolase
MILFKHFVVSTFFLASITPGICQSEIPITLSANPSVEYQTIDGFGASDAWRCQFVGKNWPLEKRIQIADLLFSQEFDQQGNPRGIGLSLWRFYISAGTAEQGDSSGIANPWRRGECFQLPNGQYDWNKQAGQQWFLRAAKERGVDKLLAFPNAAPVHISANGKGFATTGHRNINLKPGGMAQYATFLADVLSYFQEEGLAFDYLSPINEPQWEWNDGSQEGTPALNEEIYTLVKHLSHELSMRKLTTKIVIGEAGTIGHASIPMKSVGMEGEGQDDQGRFFFDASSPFYIGDWPHVVSTISAHSYHSVWPVKKQVEYRQLVQNALNEVNPSLGYWMSEYCILQKNDELGSGGGRDLGMATALYVARIIHNDLTITNAQSWQWWTALSQVDYKDGLVYLDDGSKGTTGNMGGHIKSLQHDGVVRDSKLLWTLGNFSRFVRPGMKRIECTPSLIGDASTGLLISAYRNQAKKETVFVLINQGTKEHVIQFNTRGSLTSYLTDASHNLSNFPQADHAITVPPRAVLTVISDE